MRNAWMASLKKRLRPRLVCVRLRGFSLRILFDVGDHAGIENVFAITGGIKTAIEIEIGASQVHPDLFGHLLQRFQPLR